MKDPDTGLTVIHQPEHQADGVDAVADEAGDDIIAVGGLGGLEVGQAVELDALHEVVVDHGLEQGIGAQAVHGVVDGGLVEGEAVGDHGEGRLGGPDERTEEDVVDAVRAVGTIVLLAFGSGLASTAGRDVATTGGLVSVAMETQGFDDFGHVGTLLGNCDEHCAFVRWT